MAFPTDILRLSELIADRIIGAFIATAETGARWVISNDSDVTTLDAYTGIATETSPAQVKSQISTAYPTSSLLSLFGPDQGHGQSFLGLYGDVDSGGEHTRIRMTTERVALESDLTVYGESLLGLFSDTFECIQFESGYLDTTATLHGAGGGVNVVHGLKDRAGNGIIPKVFLVANGDSSVFVAAGPNTAPYWTTTHVAVYNRRITTAGAPVLPAGTAVSLNWLAIG